VTDLDRFNGADRSVDGLAAEADGDWRRRGDWPQAADQPASGQRADWPPAGDQPASGQRGDWPQAGDQPAAEQSSDWRSLRWPFSDRWRDDGGDDPPRVRSDSSTDLVRPYIRTGGRTRGPANLGIETLVSRNPAGPAGESWPADPDHRMVLGLCVTPRSVAEVAALAALPLGVARVLLADMARIGVIRVHTPATADGAPDLALMQRVLAGLRRL
jgi:hypothetical protein